MYNSLIDILELKLDDKLKLKDSVIALHNIAITLENTINVECKICNNIRNIADQLEQFIKENYERPMGREISS